LTDRPKYIINPLLAPRTWNAEFWQLTVARNPSWINSCWLGTGWQVVDFPSRILREIVAPAMTGNLRLTAKTLVWTPISMLAFLFAGITGRLVALPLPARVIEQAVVLDTATARIAAKRPKAQFVTVRPEAD
jgi:hypothetical protein